MNIRHIIITSLCFLLTGCISSYVLSDIDLEARSHIELAAAKENASDFTEALKEYFIVSEKYPGTRYYKTAVLRSALLNIHPNNPKIDYTMALDWLQIYLDLPLTPQEKEAAVVYAALIQKINQNKNEKNKLLTIIGQQKKDKASLAQKLKQSRTKAAQTKSKLKKLSAYEAELSILEAELSNLRNKLQKIKEIDVQMYKTKKNSSE